MMYRVVSQIKEWPEYDLFNNSLPVPLNITSTETLYW
jgi:hypothetical protein